MRGTPPDIGAGAQISNGMRSAIVSIAVMVSSMFSLFRAGIPENVEPHHSPLCLGLTLGQILINRWTFLWSDDSHFGGATKSRNVKYQI